MKIDSVKFVLDGIIRNYHDPKDENDQRKTLRFAYELAGKLADNPSDESRLIKYINEETGQDLNMPGMRE